jgi:hypothetical protein
MPDQRNATTDHLGEETINLFLDGMLDEPARRRAETHLAACARCRAELGRWHEMFVALDALAPVTDTALTQVAGPSLRVSLRRIRPWVALQGIFAVGLLLLVWPRIVGWVGGIAPEGVRAWLADGGDDRFDRAARATGNISHWLDGLGGRWPDRGVGGLDRGNADRCIVAPVGRGRGCFAGHLVARKPVPAEGFSTTTAGILTLTRRFIMNKRLLAGLILLGALALVAAAPAQQEDVTPGGAIAGLLGAVILALSVLALLVTVAALLPGLHQRGLAALERSPWRALGLGLINYLFFGALFILFASVQVLGLFALFIGLALLALTTIGLAVVGRLVGDRLADWRDGSTSPLVRIVAGTAVLELAIFVPVIGWFVLLPLTSVAGLGAVVMALIWRSPVAGPSASQPAVELE